MIVVLDNYPNLFPDLRLDGPDFRLLRSYLKSSSPPGSARSAKIVFEETVNHFRNNLIERIRLSRLDSSNRASAGCLVESP